MRLRRRTSRSFSLPERRITTTWRGAASGSAVASIADCTPGPTAGGTKNGTESAGPAVEAPIEAVGLVAEMGAVLGVPDMPCEAEIAIAGGTTGAALAADVTLTEGALLIVRAALETGSAQSLAPKKSSSIGGSSRCQSSGSGGI